VVALLTDAQDGNPFAIAPVKLVLFNHIVLDLAVVFLEHIPHLP